MCEVVILAQKSTEYVIPAKTRIVQLERFDDADFNVRAVNAIKEIAPDWLFIQAGGPFSFQMTRFLPLLRAQSERINICIILHERAGYPIEGSVKKKFMVLLTDPRRFLANRRFRVLALSDLIILGVSSWVSPVWRALKGCDVRCIPIGSNIRVPDPSSDDIRSNLGIRAEELVLGQFGRGTPGLRWEAAVLSHLKDLGIQFRLLLLGRSAHERCKALSNKSVIACGPLSEQDVATHMQALDISLCFYRDGVSERRTSLMTALQFGVPIMGNIGSATPVEMIKENGRSMNLCYSRTGSEFESALRKLVQDRSYREEMGRRGRALFERQYSWSVIERHYREILFGGSFPC